MHEQNPNLQQNYLENARAAVEEASQPVIEEQAARLGGFVLNEAERLTREDAGFHVVGAEAEAYLQDGLAEELGSQAQSHLEKGSAEEIASDASLYLRVNDMLNSDTHTEPSTDLGTGSFKEQYEQFKNIQDMRSNDDFKNLRKDYE